MIKMCEFELKLEDKCPKKLGTGPTAKKIINAVNDYDEVIINFENIEFMSRSFAQEYVFQKHNTKSKIAETNMNDSIKQLLDVVEEDFQQTCKAAR